MKQKPIAIALVIILIVGAIGISIAIDDGTTVDGDIALNVSEGPAVTISYDSPEEAELYDNYPDNHTVDIRSDSGSMTLSSEGPTNASVNADEITGPWTNVSDIDLNGHELAIDPADKQQINLSGDVNTVNFRDVGVDNSEVDFVYSGDPGGSTNISIFDIGEEDRKLGAIDASTGEALATGFPDENGTVEFTELDNSLREVEIEIVPWEMRIFNETNPEQRIDGREITAEFFDLNGDSVTTLTTSNGTIPFDELDDSSYSVRLEDTGEGDYQIRQVIVKDIFAQQDIWLLNTSDPSLSVESPTFVIRDDTGSYDETASRVYIQRPLTVDNETRFRTVAAEEAGVDGYTEVLEADTRYRIIVENPDGDRRVLGKYVSDSSLTHQLDIRGLSFDLSTDNDKIEWAFDFHEVENGEDLVTFNYTDHDERTTNIEVVIYERGNASNELHNQTYTGPFGTLGITEAVPEQYNASEWVVEWDAERNPSLGSIAYIGPRGTLDIPIDPVWKNIIGVGAVLLVAGMGSRVNASLVGVAAAAMAGMLYFIGFLPAIVSGGVVIVGFAIPVMTMASSRGRFS